MKYILKDGYVVGTTTDPENIPDGYSTMDGDDILMGSKIVDGAVVPEIINEALVITPPARSPKFFGSRLFKQARIKANTSLPLSVSLQVAMFAESQGDIETALGAIKSIKDILRASGVTLVDES